MRAPVPEGAQAPDDRLPCRSEHSAPVACTSGPRPRLACLHRVARGRWTRTIRQSTVWCDATHRGPSRRRAQFRCSNRMPSTDALAATRHRSRRKQAIRPISRVAVAIQESLALPFQHRAGCHRITNRCGARRPRSARNWWSLISSSSTRFAAIRSAMQSGSIGNACHDDQDCGEDERLHVALAFARTGSQG